MKAKASLTSKELLALLSQAQELVKQRSKKPKKRGHSKRAPVSLTDQELLKVLAAARESRVRDWVMILVTFWHGLRASEVLHLRRRDLDGRNIRVQREKGSELTEQPLQEHDNPLFNEAEAVRTWLAEMGERGKKGAAKPGGRRSLDNRRLSLKKVTFRTLGAEAADPDPADEKLFPLTRQHYFRVFRQYALEAGVPARKCSPHKLKHTIAKRLLKSGVPPNEVQDWLGWKSMSMAALYGRADGDEVAESVGKAIRSVPAFRQIQQGHLFG